MRVLIADDHPLYLSAVHDQVVKLFPDAVVDTAPGLPQALSILNDSEQCDLVLIDYSMPGMNGTTGVRAAVAAAAGAPVVVMSGIADHEEVRLCIGGGARGFLPKTLEGKVFSSALNVILAGGSYIPAEMFCGAVATVPVEVVADTGVSAADLNERERSIMDMVVDGKSNKEIARLLNLREVTIKVQLTHIYRKLGARNRAQAAMLVSQRQNVA